MSSQVEPSPSQTKRATIPSLTGLRFVAAFYIMLFHYGQEVISYPPGFRQAVDQGPVAVSLFFILSGFVLTYSYFDWFRINLAQVRSFYWARFVRIAPMHVIALLVATPISLFFVDFSHVGLVFTGEQVATSWMTNLLLLHSFTPALAMHVLWNTPSWSISAEAFFYAVFPFFIRYVLSRCRSGRSMFRLGLLLYIVEVLTVIVATIALQQILARGQAGEQLLGSFWYASPIIRIWEFLQGCVVAMVVVRDGHSLPSSSGLGGSARLRNGALAATLLSIVIVMWLLTAGPLASMPSNVGAHILYSPAFVALIVVVASGRSFLTPLLDHPVLVRLGEASYSLYIIHWIPLAVLASQARAGVEPDLWLALLVMGATVVLSLGCYEAIEQPARRLLRAGWQRESRRQSDRSTGRTG